MYMEASKAVIFSLYKGKGNKSECMYYRGMGLLNTVGQVHGKVVAGRVKMISEALVGE